MCTPSLQRIDNKIRLSIDKYYLEFPDSVSNEKALMIISRELRTGANNKHSLTFQDISEGLGHDSRQYSNNFYREFENRDKDMLSFLERKNSLKESSFEIIEEQILDSPFLDISEHYKYFKSNNPEISISERTFGKYISDIDAFKLLKRIQNLVSPEKIYPNATYYLKEIIESSEISPHKKKEIVSVFPEVKLEEKKIDKSIDLSLTIIQKYILTVFLYASGLSQEIIAVLFGVSKSSVHNWIYSLCTNTLEEQILGYIRYWSGKVSFDEKWVWINNSLWYVLSAVDSLTGFPLLIELYPTLDSTSWMLFFRKFKSIYGNPLLISSDGCKRIRLAKSLIFPKVRHQLCKFHKLKNLFKRIYEYIPNQELRKRCVRLAKNIFSNKYVSSRKKAVRTLMLKEPKLADYIEKHILNCWRKLTMNLTNNASERFNRKIEKTFFVRYGIPNQESAKVLLRALWLKEVIMNGQKHLEKNSEIYSINLQKSCQEHLNFDNTLLFLSYKLNPELEKAA